MNKIKVSVIIPVYNQENLVHRCIKSIPKRDDIEIICINDGSRDRTLECLESCKRANLNDIKIITYNKNMGVSFARNKGIEMAKGDYIMFLDSDDYVYPHCFNEIVDRFVSRRVADVIFYDLEGNNKEIYKVTESTKTCKWGMFKFIKRTTIGDIRFSEGMQYAEDKDFYMKIVEKNPSYYITSIVMYHYNYPREGSLSAIGENR